MVDCLKFTFSHVSSFVSSFGNKTGNKTGNNWKQLETKLETKLETTGNSVSSCFRFVLVTSISWILNPSSKILYAKWRYERSLSFRYKISSKHHQIPIAINEFKTKKSRSKIVDLSSKINDMEGVEVSDPKCFSKNYFEIDHIRSW